MKEFSVMVECIANVWLRLAVNGFGVKQMGRLRQKWAWQVIAVRTARPADVHNITKLAAGAGCERWVSDADLEISLTYSHIIGWVACVRTIVGALRPGYPLAGFILTRLQDGEAEISMLAVDQSWRRAGIGGRLLSVCRNHLSERRTACLSLEVASDNAPAICLYERDGFFAVPQQARGGSRSGSEALKMRRMLP